MTQDKSLKKELQEKLTVSIEQTVNPVAKESKKVKKTDQ